MTEISPYKITPVPDESDDSSQGGFWDVNSNSNKKEKRQQWSKSAQNLTERIAEIKSKSNVETVVIDEGIYSKAAPSNIEQTAEKEPTFSFGDIQEIFEQHSADQPASGLIENSENVCSEPSSSPTNLGNQEDDDSPKRVFEGVVINEESNSQFSRTTEPTVLFESKIPLPKRISTGERKLTPAIKFDGPSKIPSPKKSPSKSVSIKSEARSDGSIEHLSLKLAESCIESALIISEDKIRGNGDPVQSRLFGEKADDFVEFHIGTPTSPTSVRSTPLPPQNDRETTTILRKVRVTGMERGLFDVEWIDGSVIVTREANGGRLKQGDVIVAVGGKP